MAQPTAQIVPLFSPRDEDTKGLGRRETSNRPPPPAGGGPGGPRARLREVMEAACGRRGTRVLLGLTVVLVLAMLLLGDTMDARGPTGLASRALAAATSAAATSAAATSADGPEPPVAAPALGPVGPPASVYLLRGAVTSGGDTPPPGPSVVSTRGEPWPMVQRRAKYGGFLVVRHDDFKFKATQENCELLQAAFKRYARVLQLLARGLHGAEEANDVEPAGQWQNQRFFRGFLNALDVQLQKRCEAWPRLRMDERYELRVDPPDAPGTAVLRARSIWGVLRGLETFVQLIAPDSTASALIINSTEIEDYPRFPHRGLLLDTSRHYQPLSEMLRTIDALEANKMNVLHWHIVDDQSFPYQSKVFPALSEKGAYHPSMIYTPDDIKKVIEYARVRGIRVIPEFDTPGHTRSWGEGIPELLTPCYTDERPDGTYGPINPTINGTYDILKTFFNEVRNVFADKYIHLGGDEVSFTCWASNPSVLRFMQEKGISNDFPLLENMYIQRLLQTINAMNASSIVWQEVFDNGVQLAYDTVVHVWIGDYSAELSKVTRAQHQALLSTCWYLDHLLDGGDWHKYYHCDPHDFVGSEEQKRLVLGGEACMWGESVDETNIHSRVWPRASAAAEKLWSAYNVQDIVEAAQRLEEHTCRMKRRGIPAQPPNGPGFCVL